MHDFFDRIVCVNLKRRTDRLANFRRELERINWPFKEPIIFEAIDGNIVPCPEGWQQGGGAYGCRQSHTQILERAITDGVKHLLVLEDDACFFSDFNEQVNKFISNVPQDFDGLMLGGQHIQPPTKVSDGIVLVRNCQRTHGYSVRGKYMRAVYSKWMEPNTKVHIDWLWPQVQKHFKVYAPDPLLIGQDRSKSDINGAVNPRKMWNAPSADAPIILFKGERKLFEDMREYGWHGGYDRDGETGIDKGLLNLFQSENPARKLHDWIVTLQWECASMENSIVVIWHPLATSDIVKGAWQGPIYEIEAETITDCLNKMPSAQVKQIIPAKHFVVILKCSNEVANDLAGYGFHRGYWRDSVTGIDNGLRAIYHEGATPERLNEWLNALLPEAEAMKGVVTVWHPDATLEMWQRATQLQVVEIQGETTSDILQKWRDIKQDINE
jgi:hypothetical protein